MNGPRRRLDVVIAALGGTVFALSAINAITSYADRLGIPFFDWQFYSAAVSRWLAGEPIYPGGRISTLGSAAGSSYAYPPASVPLMLPFASWPGGAILWETVIVSTLLFGTWSVVRKGWPNRPLIPLAICLTVMAALDGVMQGIALGNVNIATAGILGLVWTRTRGMDVAAGVLGVIKVFPIALAAPLGPRILGRALVVAGVICLVTLPLVGLAAWSDYISGLQASEPLCRDPVWTNLSLACAVEPYLGVIVAKWLGLVLAAIFVVLALRTGPTFAGMALATGAVLAPATELHAHYFAVVVVLIVIGFADLNLRTSMRRAAST